MSESVASSHSHVGSVASAATKDGDVLSSYSVPLSAMSISGGYTQPPEKYKEEFELNHIRDTPLWMRWNPNVHTHYRVHFSWWLSFKSIFRLHNETLNIWTALPGIFVFVYAAVDLIMACEAQEDCPTSLKVYFVLFPGGAAVCMLASTYYHTVLCRDHHTYHAGLFCDFMGITTVIVGCFFPPIAMSYVCLPFWRNVYLGMITALGSVAVVGPWFAWFHSPRTKWFRNGLFVLMGGSGMAPILHSVLWFPDEPLVDYIEMLLLLQYVAFGVGLFFYLTQYPESKYAGEYDVFGASHQWWHLFVLMGLYMHTTTCRNMFLRWVEMHDSCDAFTAAYESGAPMPDPKGTDGVVGYHGTVACVAVMVVTVVFWVCVELWKRGRGKKQEEKAE